MAISPHRTCARGTAVAAAGFAIAALPGCMVGPNYARPTTPRPDRFTETPLPTSTGIAHAAGSIGTNQLLEQGADIDGAWWRNFHSRPLTTLVERALQQNPSLAAAQQTLHQAQETTLAQEGNFFPTITGQLSRQRIKESGADLGVPGLSETFSLYSAQLNVSYTFDVWGANRRSVQADQAAASYQRFEFEAAANMLAANTATAIINAASLAAQINAEQALVGAEQRLLTTVQSQFELGAATGTDVATQQAQLAQTEALVVPLQTQLAQARDQIAAYTGRVPAEADMPEVSLDDLSLPAALPVSLPSSLASQRPDIRAAEAQLQQATANLGVAIANRLPQITLSGFLGSSPASFYQLFTPGTGAFTLTNQVLQPIFNGGTLLHQQRAAKAALKAAAANYQNVVVTAFQNVADVLTAVVQDRRALQVNQDAERAAARSLSLAQTQYQAGSVAYLTVLTSQSQYQTAVINLIRAEAARYTDSVALFAALGGGWWNRDLVQPASPGVFRSLLP
jgi:NodT family efflux transporter outer membrane factor (OMF) lipoprotein